MHLQENQIKELINIIDWAVIEGYGGLEGSKPAIEILKILVREVDANKYSDDYFKETYGIE